MSKQKSGLGRGLGSLLYEKNVDLSADKSSVNTIRITDVQPRSSQPRKEFDPSALESLADSISRHGLIQPIIVRKGSAGYYEIIAGERRWRAAKMAGLTEIPAIVIEADDRKTAELSLIENVQREDLNPIEIALAYRALIDEFGLTQEELAERVGKSRPAVANTLLLLDLPETVIAMVISKKLSEGHARALRAIKDRDKMLIAAGIVAEKGLSVRDAEALARRLNAECEEPAEAPQKSLAESVDYRAALEKKMQARLGRRVTIKNKGKIKKLELEFVDNADLEALAELLCGKSIFDD